MEGVLTIAMNQWLVWVVVVGHSLAGVVVVNHDLNSILPSPVSLGTALHKYNIINRYVITFYNYGCYISMLLSEHFLN